MGFWALLNNESIFLHEIKCPMVQNDYAHMSEILIASKYFDAQSNQPFL
jgi:hypothetical protein